MTVVVIYGFTGKYSGDAEYTWNHPEVGATHKCMLFLRQDSDASEYQAAVAECGRYGFTNIENMRYGKLQVEVLNTDLYRGFAGFYEDALQEGSTLLFYPNKDANGAAT
ncbi:hypothetical protein HEP74_00393 [Xanthomonas sp. SS]|uniref:hypothetical protein n=1 Tax=Xanthomonas sp. SS TaxID=2724122 RepID=UPI0016397EB0|nr:hypothetical protein [Xanthomonas sp. SS]QNH15275.1 hypothetical protein HEP74_00393 [Xanthomonas sp. SS]